MTWAENMRFGSISFCIMKNLEATPMRKFFCIPNSLKSDFFSFSLVFMVM